MNRRNIVVGAFGAILLVGGVGFWRFNSNRPHKKISSNQAYDAMGYGGFTAKNGVANIPITPKPAAAVEPDRAAMDLYRRGKYAEIEQLADSMDKKTDGVARSSAHPKTVKQLVQASKVKMLAAYSSAKRKDFESAKKRFLAAGVTAHETKQNPAPALSNKMTLEAECAYEAIVCDQAMGKKEEAKQEYVAFMEKYPNSPLVRGAVLRLTKLYNGTFPPEVNKAWDALNKKAQANRVAAERDQSLCGPGCVAELALRKRPKLGSRVALIARYAKELKTSDRGTSVTEMSKSLKGIGYAPKGVRLTEKGLRGQKLPLIAFVAPEHFVIVDELTATGVGIWDPDQNGPGLPGARTVSLAEWRKMWDGVAIKL